MKDRYPFFKLTSTISIVGALAIVILAIAMGITTVRPTFIPAYRAALGLSPTVRISKPMVVFHRSHQMTPAVTNAMTMHQ